MNEVPLILVVEDDDHHALLIQRSFEDAPEEFRLVLVDTLLAAKTAVGQCAPDLVLTDYKLPDGEGSELVAITGGACPVIIMTSHGTEQLAVESMKNGAQDYIVKSPETFEALPHTVTLALKAWSRIQSLKLADEAILRAKTDWECTFDAVPDLIAIIDTNRTITRVNRAMADRCGLPADEIIGRKCHEIMHDSAVPHANCPYERMINDGAAQSAHIEEKRLNSVFDISVSPIFASDGRITSYVHVARDITDHTRLENELKQAKDDWESAFDSLTDMVTIHDTNFNIVRANSSARRMLGLPEQLSNAKCFMFFHGMGSSPEDCLSCTSLKSGHPCSFEIFEPHLNRHLEVRGIPKLDSHGRCIGLVHVVRDITERKQAEEERQRLEQQFNQAQKLESLGVLAGGIAHDFNNILSVILGHCYMAREELISGQDFKATFMQIESAGNRAADLCRQMLAYAGKSPLVQTRVNLKQLTDEVIRMLQAAIRKNVTILPDLSSDVPEIMGDTGQLQQIIMNLIINASDAIGEASGFISVTLKKEVIAADQIIADLLGSQNKNGIYCCLEVTDSGCGMSEETRKRIFEPFFTTKSTGRGLGMSAILGIIKSHKGILQLTSKVGVGTTFTVFFPATDSPDCAEETSQLAASATKVAGGTVLLVEDEEVLRMMGIELLGAMGFSVLTASDGGKALDIYRERGGEINVILLDMIMPVMGGIEAYHELRVINPKVPIIICSGYGVDTVETIIDSDPYAGFLHKPYNPADLKNLLIRMIV